MNTGVISSRYAAALLKYVDETGNGKAVCAQVLTLQKALTTVPELQKVVDDTVGITTEEKLSLFRSALGDTPVSDELVRFLNLLIRNRRISYLKFVFHAFLSMYYKSRNIRCARLVTVKDDPGLEAKLKALVKSRTGDDVVLETEVDPKLLGGFVFEIDDYRIDASVAHQLDVIRRQFIEKNRRIV